jgi:hypothetical protein
MISDDKKIIHISIEKYDTLLDKWLEETKRYVDQYNLSNVMRDFDESCGIKHSETSFDDVDFDDFYAFEVVNGPKFMVSVLKYELYDK